MNWTYSQPIKIIFGINKIIDLHKILSDLNLKNGILVADPLFVENGLINNILDYSNGLITNVFSNITPNPTVDNVDECAQLIRDNNNEFVIALGGGSSLDCAKAAASVCMTTSSITEFHSGKLKFGKEHLPLIAIPTTSGTGSEVTSVSVLTDPKKGVKAPMVSDNFNPLLAIIDPALTISVPKNITASTGMDVLSHALEAFWSKNHQPICDALALHCAKLVFDNLIKAYDDGNNLEAREKMSEASVMAGLAFALPKTAGSHACSFPLTNTYHIPHGEACALTLDYFLRINSKFDNGRLNTFCKQLGFKNVEEVACRIFEMKKHMGLLTRLRDAGIKETELETLAEASQHLNMRNNPADMTQEKIIEMYKKLY